MRLQDHLQAATSSSDLSYYKKKKKNYKVHGTVANLPEHGRKGTCNPMLIKADSDDSGKRVKKPIQAELQGQGRSLSESAVQ